MEQPRVEIPLLIIAYHDAFLWAAKQKNGLDDEYQQILKAVGLKNVLSKEVDNVLITRKLAYWNHLDRLVLSNGGLALLDHMHTV